MHQLQECSVHVCHLLLFVVLASGSFSGYLEEIGFRSNIEHGSVCSCHVTWAFQSESTLYSWLNVKELLTQSRCKIWSLSDCNWTRTQNHLVCKGTLSHLAKLQILRLLWARNSLISRQLYSVDSLWTRTWNEKMFWLNGWVFIYELSGSEFKSSCSQLNMGDREYKALGICALLLVDDFPKTLDIEENANRGHFEIKMLELENGQVNFFKEIFGYVY